MSEQNYMVEVKTEPYESDYLNSVCKNTNMVDSHSRQDKVTTVNMSEQVDMVEVGTEPNESDKLISVCKNTNMVTNHSRKDNITSESNNHTLITFKLSFKKVMF